MTTATLLSLTNSREPGERVSAHRFRLHILGYCCNTGCPWVIQGVCFDWSDQIGRDA